MISDKFGNVIYNSKDLLRLIYSGNIDQIDSVFCEKSKETEQLKSVSDLNIKFLDESLYSVSIEDFDSVCQNEWFMPEEYKNMDIEGFLVDICPKEHYQRLIDELQEFRARKMIPLLQWLKYLVDTCRSNDIVWGVGRGSSVSSFVLFLIGVHKIDPIKYNLDWRDFLR